MRIRRTPLLWRHEGSSASGLAVAQRRSEPWAFGQTNLTARCLRNATGLQASSVLQSSPAIVLTIIDKLYVRLVVASRTCPRSSSIDVPTGSELLARTRTSHDPSVNSANGPEHF